MTTAEKNNPWQVDGEALMGCVTNYFFERSDGTTIISLYEAAALLNKYEAAIRQTLEENAHLADGENCTLAALKKAMEGGE
jgi:hypothetical protein